MSNPSFAGNPAGALSGAVLFATVQDKIPPDTREHAAGAAIVAKSIVSLSTTVEGRVLTGAADSIVGVALTAAVNAGDIIKVAINGCVTAVPYTGSAPAAGAVVYRSATAGAVDTSTSSNRRIGYATALGAGGFVNVFLQL